MWESNLFSAIIGGIIGILGTVIGEILAHKFSIKDQSRNIVKDFVLANPEIFPKIEEKLRAIYSEIMSYGYDFFDTRFTKE